MSAYYVLHVTPWNFVFSFKAKIFAKINKSRSINKIMQVFCPAPDEEGFTSHALPAAESVWQAECETK